MNHTPEIAMYQRLIEEFVSGQIKADEFESQYLTLFKQQTGELPEPEFETLNQLFTDVDAYCADPELRDEDDISEEELVASAKSALQQLRAYAPDRHI
ncbi:colicin immunity domain-containing protein [Marinobacter sp. LN3S78]|uniref:colicin immunity domain-containing protein n=1 Tax=Marinobacter sp. LN3S78 TaxID=3382300 RepID=UPI00387B69E8